MPHFVWTGFLVGLLGSPHCLLMCSGLCARACPRAWNQVFLFHLVRSSGYAVAGALVTAMAQSLVYILQGYASGFRWVWIFFHIVFAIAGLFLLIRGHDAVLSDLGLQKIQNHFRQTKKIHILSKYKELNIKNHRPTWGIFYKAGLWFFLPCGFLYSSLWTAALSGSVFAGSLFMFLFGLGTAVPLLVGQIGGQWFMRYRKWDRYPAWQPRALGAMWLFLSGVALWKMISSSSGHNWCGWSSS
jgi:sulfite exporter TauE/SafE